MISHYLEMALAKFARSPFTTLANVLTLALGLACFMTAYGIAAWWQTADRYHAAADRLFVVGQIMSHPETDTEMTNGMSSPTLARYLAEDFPEVEQVARIMPSRDVAVSAGTSKALLDVGNIDPAFLEMFDFTYLEGSGEAALADPTGVVLTREAAERLFGPQPALGRAVLIEDSRQATVTAVIAPVRQPSFMGSGQEAILSFDMLAQWETTPLVVVAGEGAGWAQISGFTFVTLRPGASLEALNRRLPALVEARVPPDQRQAGGAMRTQTGQIAQRQHGNGSVSEGRTIQRLQSFALEAFPVNELTTVRLDNQLFTRGNLGLSAVSVLIGLGILTLIVAGVNYANLATAQAAGRAREIGMRKVLGARRLDVMTQSWLESLLLTMGAAILAFGVLLLAAPMVRTSTGIDILHFLTQGIAPFLLVLGLIVLVALAAGAYPALVMSRIRPAEALQTGQSRSGSRLLASILIVIQFASASFLLILVLVTQMQRAHLEQVGLAAHDDPVVFLNDLRAIDVDYGTLEARLANLPGVREVSAVDLLPWRVGGRVMQLSLSADVGAGRVMGYVKRVGYDYFPAVGLNPVAGRLFDRSQDLPGREPSAAEPGYTPSIVIDEAFAQALGFNVPRQAIGTILYLPATGGRSAVPAAVIGVIEAEAMRLEDTGVVGHVYELMSDAPAIGRVFPVLRIAPDNVAGTLAAVTRVWDSLAPNIAIQTRFLDQLFEESFRTHSRMGQLFLILAAAAFIIAAIGQLGLAVQVTRRRRHEIGVRKILGSTSLGVVRLLLVDFSKPVIIANMIAWPFAWLAAFTYLQAFAHRIELTPIPFLISLAVTLAIAWVAIIGEVLKAASVRPAEVLRHA